MASNDVYERLREEIVLGRLGAGASLVESTLGARYGTSRTPIREALRRLEQDGLIERGAKGLQVRSRSPEEILEIYGVRIELEGLAAARAAESRTELDLARLRRSAEAMSSVNLGDNESMVSANYGFHRALWHASHNATLVDLLDRLQSYLTRYPTTTLSVPGRWDAAQAEHDLLIQLIADRDVEGARTEAMNHMGAARDIRLQMYLEEVSHDDFG